MQSLEGAGGNCGVLGLFRIGGLFRSTVSDYRALRGLGDTFEDWVLYGDKNNETYCSRCEYDNQPKRRSWVLAPARN